MVSDIIPMGAGRPEREPITIRTSMTTEVNRRYPKRLALRPPVRRSGPRTESPPAEGKTHGPAVHFENASPDPGLSLARKSDDGFFHQCHSRPQRVLIKGESGPGRGIEIGESRGASQRKSFTVRCHGTCPVFERIAPYLGCSQLS